MQMAMETRTPGRTGLEVSTIGLGTEHLINSHENMDAVLDLAVPAGVNYIDLVYNDPLDSHSDFWRSIGPGIRRLRDRLAALDPTHQYISTVRGHGVRLDNPPA
jgi:predicted aldo/keto reductase-like oxidoreductase